MGQVIFLFFRAMVTTVLTIFLFLWIAIVLVGSYYYFVHG